MIVSNYSIKNRTTVFVLMLIIAIVGAYCYVTLPRESAPDIQIPYIVVTTTYKGVAPSDIENLVTKEIETKIRSISDVDEITSTSAEGMSTIMVKFFPSTDLDTALQKVRDKVDSAKGEMPNDIDEPTVSEINISEFPIMLLNIHGSCGLLQLKDIAEDLQDDLEKIDGVLEARISGGLTRQIRIEVDPYRLAAYHLPVPALFSVIAAENQNVSGGSLDITEAKYSVRVEGEFLQPSDIFTLVVHQVDGRPIYLSDVAAVRDTFEDRLSISRFNGQESVTVAVVKRAGKNIVEIADKVKAVVADYQANRVPTGTRIDITGDQSKAIGMMVGDLENNMISGLILVVGVLMVVMGLRNSILVAMAIPFSMLLTFAVLSAMGITLNMIVLFSLILVLGMLVDNAIVIVENIYRHMQEGTPRIQAAMVATAEVAWPVITSTLTTLAAFVPMLWWTGIMGEFMCFLPKTLIIALTASLFVALVINPTLCAVFVRVKGRKTGGATPAAPKIDDEDMPPQTVLGTQLMAGYRAVLTLAIRPWIRLGLVVAGVLVLVASGVAFYFLNGKVELFPSGDPNNAQVNITMPVGTRLEETDRVARLVEEVVRKYQYTDGADPARNIKFVTTNVGSSGGSAIGTFMGGGGGGSNLAQISIEFQDFDDRRVPSDETVKALRRELVGFPGVEVRVDVEKEGPPTGRPVEIRVCGDSYTELVRLAGEVKKIMATIPGVADLDDDYNQGKPELKVVVDRQKAGKLGLTTGGVAQVLKAGINGIEVGKYRDGNDDYDIVVRLPDRFRREINDLMALTVATDSADQVPLSSAIDRIDYTSGLASIQRIDEKRTITVFSDVIKGHPNNSNKIIALAQEKLRNIELPSGYSISFVGEQKEQNEASAFLLKAGVVAILGIALILVAQFNSITLPLIVMMSVLMSWIGVFLGLTITGMPFGVIMTGIGVISLAGVVVNNAIVLIDYIEKLRHRGLPLVEAVLRAGSVRLRPVLLTAITTILGLMPMVLGWNLDFRNLAFNWRSESSIWWGPMATVVVFGLAVATVLTLVVVPAVYIMLDPLRAGWDRKHHDPARDVPAR